MQERARHVGAGAIATMAVLGGCESAPIAYHTAESERATLRLPLDGPYDGVVHSYFTGSIRVRLVARPTGEGFTAITRPGVAWDLVGGVEGFLGPLVASSLFPGGVILVWESGLPRGSAAGEGTIGAGRALTVPTRLHAPDRPVEILYQGRRLGVLTLAAGGVEGPGERNYGRVVDEVEATLREELFDPSVAQAAPMRRYLARLRSVAALAEDDLEFAFGAEVARRRIPLPSQLLLLRELDEDVKDELSGEDGISPWLSSISVEDGVARVRVDAFAREAEVERRLEEALGGEPAGLILDLRNCRVGDLSAFRVAARLLEEPTVAGSIFRPGQSDEGVTDLDAREAENPSELDRALNGARGRTGSVRVVVRPGPRVYRGPVVVVTSRVTASSAEALAALLQASGRARVVGERTAGKMLVPRRVSLSDGWVLQYPAYDYRTAEGHRLEGRGVSPDVAAPRSRALEAAQRLVREASTEARRGKG